VPVNAARDIVANAVANPIDADEADLEERMIAADLAGHETRANAYQRKLERLREAKARGLIVLSNERARRGQS
jgi:hypothetical protein